MKIFETFEDTHKFYIVIERMYGESLPVYLARQPPAAFTERMVASIMCQILSGLCNCHLHHIAHMDIKPENLLFADKECKTLKLVDFGFARVFDAPGSGFREILGSPLYMAPEICIKKPHDTKCDIWSCGVLCYMLLCGEPPYVVGPETSLPMLLTQIKDKSFSLAELRGPVWSIVSDEAKKFTLRMLTKEPTQRASAEELLTDPWMKDARDVPASQEETKHVLSGIVRRNVRRDVRKRNNRRSKRSSRRRSRILCTTLPLAETSRSSPRFLRA